MTGQNTQRPAYWVRKIPLSELNIATTLAYNACRAAGTHRPGPRFTSPRPPPRGQAQGLYVEMRVCRTCGVPCPPMGGYSMRTQADRAAMG